MDFIIAIILLLLMVAVYYLILNWWIVLVVAGVVLFVFVIAVIISKSELEHLRKDVISTDIIREEPIIERVAENTGYSIGYGRHISSREYYRYKNVITGYKVVFNVLLKNGEHRVIECRKDSTKYKILFAKKK